MWIVDESRQPPSLRTALFGGGAGVLDMHRPGLEGGPFQVVALCDIDPARGEPAAAGLGCAFFCECAPMLAETQPEVAVVMTPHPSHAPLALACLEAGCHVLVEKPMALHAGEADEMIAAAGRVGRLLAVNLQQRFRPEVRAAKALLAAGELGEIQHVEMTVVWPRTARYYGMSGWRGTWRGEGGGLLMNQSPHNLDLLCHLAGMPARVSAWTRTLLHAIETEDTAQAMLEWPNGALGGFHASTAENGQPERLEILGTAGRLELRQGGLVFQRFRQDLRSYVVETDLIWEGPPVDEVETALPPGAGDHAAVYANLYAAITTGAPLMADGAEGRMSLELANAMLLSSHTGRAVEFPLDRAAYAAFLDEKRAARHTEEG